MASLFDQFSKTESTPVDEQPLDPEIPEGEDMPSSKELTDVIAKVNAQNNSHGHPDEATNPVLTPEETGADTPLRDDVDDDIMSLHSDVNHQKRVMDGLSSDIAELRRQVGLIPKLDAQVRQMEKEVAEANARTSATRQELDAVKQSFNMYQASTANKIASVERQTVNVTATGTAQPDVSIVPPDMVQSERTPEGQKVPEPTPQARRVANLSEW